jgi:hypothetical protein
VRASEAAQAMEDVDGATLTAMVTYAKLRGSSMVVRGHTQPEGWPYWTVITVVKPGNEPALDAVRECEARLRELSPIVEAKEERPWP